MKINKKVISVVLSIMIMVLSIFLGSAKDEDAILKEVTEISYKLFNQNEEKINYRGYFTNSYLKGLDGEEDYILSVGSLGGYAIYEKESLELIEYGVTGNSPYSGIETTNRAYGGPAQHFKIDGDKMQDIKTGERFEKEELTIVAEKLKDKIKTDREKRKASSDVVIDKPVVMSASEQVLSAGPTGEAKKDADEYNVLERTRIPHFRYFKEIDIWGFGDNINETCASVAAQLLLSYNNWINDGRIIPEATDNPQEKFFRGERTDEIRSQPYHQYMLGTNSEEDYDDNEISFYEKILEYVNPNGPGATLTETRNGINGYLADYAPNVDVTMSVYDLWIFSDSSLIKTNVQNEIDAGRPLIAGIDTYTDGEKGAHAVVIYGYQTIEYDGQNIDGFIAHFGWINEYDYSHIWFNSSWVNGYLTFRTSHQHNNVIFDANRHIHECTICKRTTYNSNHIYNDFNRIYYEIGGLDKNYHEKVCECGQTGKEYHEFTYSYVSTEEHRAYCAKCNVTIYQNHMYKNGNGCFRCDYEKPYE